jgi:hypothetical protein
MNEKQRSGFWGALGCFVGLHRWRVTGISSILNPCPVERCDRCGIGRQFNVAGVEARYTSEKMDKAMKRRQPSSGVSDAT